MMLLVIYYALNYAGMIGWGLKFVYIQICFSSSQHSYEDVLILNQYASLEPCAPPNIFKDVCN